MELNVDFGDGHETAEALPKAVFIRAPAVMAVGPGVKVLARVRAFPSTAAQATLQSSGKTITAISPMLPTGEIVAVAGPPDLDLSQLGVASDGNSWNVAVAVRQVRFCCCISGNVQMAV